MFMLGLQIRFNLSSYTTDFKFCHEIVGAFHNFFVSLKRYLYSAFPFNFEIEDFGKHIMKTTWIGFIKKIVIFYSQVERYFANLFGFPLNSGTQFKYSGLNCSWDILISPLSKELLICFKIFFSYFY